MMDNRAMFKPRFYAVLLLVCVLPHSTAFASKTVTSATVTAGETSIESKSEYVIDHRPSKAGAWKEKMNIAHGFTSFWASEIETNVEPAGRPHDEAQFTTIEWKNKFQFTKEADFGIDTGARFSYVYNLSGAADSIELKLLAAKTIGKTSHRANLILTREVGRGANDQTNWGLSWSSRYKLNDAIQLGFELYSTFGEIGNEPRRQTQDHRLGPVFYGKAGKKLSYEAGYLVGITNAAPDGTLKLILKYKF